MSRASEMILARVRALKHGDDSVAALVRPGATAILDKLAATLGESGPRKLQGLTILSNGLGRDSATMVALLVQGKLVLDGKEVKPTEVDIVIFSDPGNEWKYTLKVKTRLGALLDQVGVAHVTLEKPPKPKYEGWLKRKQDEVERLLAAGYRGRRFTDAIKSWQREHPQPWLGQDWAAAAVSEGREVWRVKAQGGGYHRRPPILEQRNVMRWGTSFMGHACTIGHKIDPIDAFLNDWTLDKHGVKLKGKKDSWQALVKKGRAEPHRIIIGMAADEVSRIERGRKAMAAAGYKRALYPLHEMGITKEGESKFLKDVRLKGKRYNLDDIKKSGCMMCHYADLGFYWVLRQTEPQTFREIVQYQHRAHEKNPKWSIKGVVRVTTKRDAIPRLVALGERARGTPRNASKQEAEKLLSKGMSKDEALERLAELDPAAVAPVLIEELVTGWRQRYPRATVEQVLDKGYDRCGAFNRCDHCGSSL